MARVRGNHFLTAAAFAPYQFLNKDIEITANHSKLKEVSFKDNPKQFSTDFELVLNKLEAWGIANLKAEKQSKTEEETQLEKLAEEFKSIKENLFDESYSGNQNFWYFEILKTSLITILTQLNNVDIPLKLRKNEYYFLCQHLSACAPGLFNHIRGVLLALDTNVSITASLAKFRDTLVEEYASDFVNRNQKLIPENNQIHVKHFLHLRCFYNGMNTMPDIEKNKDIFESHTYLKEEDFLDFENFFLRRYNSNRIVENICLSFNAKFNQLVKHPEIHAKCKSKANDTSTFIYNQKLYDLTTKLVQNMELCENASNILSLSDDQNFMILSQENLKKEVIQYANKNLFQEPTISDSLPYIFKQIIPTILYNKSAKPNENHLEIWNDIPDEDIVPLLAVILNQLNEVDCVVFLGALLDLGVIGLKNLLHDSIRFATLLQLIVNKNKWDNLLNQSKPLEYKHKMQLIKSISSENRVVLYSKLKFGSNTSLLYQALKEGNCKDAEILVKCNLDDLSNVLDSNPKPALHLAVESGNLALVKWLVEEKKVDVNYIDLQYRETAFHLLLKLVNIDLESDKELICYFLQNNEVDITLENLQKMSIAEILRALPEDEKIDRAYWDKLIKMNRDDYILFELEKLDWLLCSRFVDFVTINRTSVNLFFATTTGLMKVFTVLPEEKWRFVFALLNDNQKTNVEINKVLAYLPPELSINLNRIYTQLYPHNLLDTKNSAQIGDIPVKKSINLKSVARIDYTLRKNLENDEKYQMQRALNKDLLEKKLGSNSDAIKKMREEMKKEAEDKKLAIKVKAEAKAKLTEKSTKAATTHKIDSMSQKADKLFFIGEVNRPYFVSKNELEKADILNDRNRDRLTLLMTATEEAYQTVPILLRLLNQAHILNTQTFMSLYFNRHELLSIFFDVNEMHLNKCLTLENFERYMLKFVEVAKESSEVATIRL